jgi:hypothetical protein
VGRPHLLGRVRTPTSAGRRAERLALQRDPAHDDPTTTPRARLVAESDVSLTGPGGHRSLLSSLCSELSGGLSLQGIALALGAAALLGLQPIASGGTARLRHPCPKHYTRNTGSLSATAFSPGCGGAALMASDIYYDATRRFPRPLPKRYVAYAHGTNTAGDPRAVYRCSISNQLVRTRDGAYRRTTALCLNSAGDSFKYIFEMA